MLFWKSLTLRSVSNPGSPFHFSLSVPPQWFLIFPLLLVLFLPGTLLGATMVIDFESFVDGDVLTNQLPGFTFNNTMVLTAGISLNETDFPPDSGTNVAFDSGGPISIVFDTPILGFAGYFTYVQLLTLTAFDSLNAPVGSAFSSFSNNTGTGGDPSSSPNELIQVNFASGISSVLITASPEGGSFVVDDLTLTTADATTPEPATVVLMMTGLAAVAFRCWKQVSD